MVCISIIGTAFSAARKYPLFLSGKVSRSFRDTLLFVFDMFLTKINEAGNQERFKKREH